MMRDGRGPRVEYYDDTKGEPVYGTSSGHRVTVEEPEDEAHTTILPSQRERDDVDGMRWDGNPVSPWHDHGLYGSEGSLFGAMDRFFGGGSMGGFGDMFSRMDRMMNEMESRAMADFGNERTTGGSSQAFYSTTTTRMGPDGQMYSETRETVCDGRTGESKTRVVTRRGNPGDPYYEETENILEDGSRHGEPRRALSRAVADEASHAPVPAPRGWWPFRRHN